MKNEIEILIISNSLECIFLDDETSARRKFAAAGKVSLWSFLVNSHLVKFKVSVYFSLIKLIFRYYRCFMSSDVFGDDFLFYKKKTYNFSSFNFLIYNFKRRSCKSSGFIGVQSSHNKLQLRSHIWHWMVVRWNLLSYSHTLAISHSQY